MNTHGDDLILTNAIFLVIFFFFLRGDTAFGNMAPRTNALLADSVENLEM